MDTAELSMHKVKEVRVAQMKQSGRGGFYITAYIINDRDEAIELSLYGCDDQPIVVKMGEEW